MVLLLPATAGSSTKVALQAGDACLKDPTGRKPEDHTSRAGTGIPYSTLPVFFLVLSKCDDHCLAWTSAQVEYGAREG